jgi:hypothetical protein
LNGYDYACVRPDWRASFSSAGRRFVESIPGLNTSFGEAPCPPTPESRSLTGILHSPFCILHSLAPDPQKTLLVKVVLVVEPLHATALPLHLFVLFVVFVVPARTFPTESKKLAPLLALFGTFSHPISLQKMIDWKQQQHDGA